MRLILYLIWYVHYVWFRHSPTIFNGVRRRDSQHLLHAREWTQNEGLFKFLDNHWDRLEKVYTVEVPFAFYITEEDHGWSYAFRCPVSHHFEVVLLMLQPKALVWWPITSVVLVLVHPEYFIFSLPPMYGRHSSIHLGRRFMKQWPLHTDCCLLS